MLSPIKICNITAVITRELVYELKNLIYQVTFKHIITNSYRRKKNEQN